MIAGRTSVRTRPNASFPVSLSERFAECERQETDGGVPSHVEAREQRVSQAPREQGGARIAHRDGGHRERKEHREEVEGLKCFRVPPGEAEGEQHRRDEPEQRLASGRAADAEKERGSVDREHGDPQRESDAARPVVHEPIGGRAEEQGGGQGRSSDGGRDRRSGRPRGGHTGRRRVIKR